MKRFTIDLNEYEVSEIEEDLRKKYYVVIISKMLEYQKMGRLKVIKLEEDKNDN